MLTLKVQFNVGHQTEMVAGEGEGAAGWGGAPHLEAPAGVNGSAQGEGEWGYDKVL